MPLFKAQGNRSNSDLYYTFESDTQGKIDSRSNKTKLVIFVNDFELNFITLTLKNSQNMFNLLFLCSKNMFSFVFKIVLTD